MRRRKFIRLFGSSVLAWPFAAHAQQAGSARSIGMLTGYDSNPVAQSLVAVFRTALTKLGWTEGSNLRIELRWGAGNAERIGSFAKELVDLRPDAIFAHSTPVLRALARETRTIPIVFAGVSDPIGSGFAASLAHPGGNITGFANDASTMGGKWVELLKEVAPRTTRVAVLFNPATAVPIQSFMPSIEAAASSLAVEVNVAPVHAKDEIEGVIATQTRDPGGSLVVMPDAFNLTNRDLIIALAVRYSVPAIYSNRFYAKAGGLIAYGADLAEQFRLAAGYIDRILKGTKPDDLAVQEPTKFETVVNLRAAKALRIEVPHNLLVLADEVIE
jgi:putative tryptophan/tyrosine transport system substrate-binding protein